MSAPRLSVFVIALNEERNLERCLSSVAWADEIVVVDSGSADKTPQIAARYGAVHSRAFTDYADQKNFAMEKTTGDWLLSIDADEEVTPQLKDEILAAAASGAADAFRVRRSSFIFGRRFRFTGTQDDKPIRLFRRGSARFEQPVHETLRVQGAVVELKTPLNHYTYPSFGSYLERFGRYTSMEAAYLKSKCYRPNLIDFLVKPLAMFLRLYFAKQGFRDGFQGFVFSALSGAYVFAKYAKAAK
jgi:glycosyltransferase involved in cell wall biosynthesis